MNDEMPRRARPKDSPPTAVVELPFGPMYFREVFGVIATRGWTNGQVGAAFKLFAAQHECGDLPPDLAGLRAIVGRITTPELTAVINTFFPVDSSGLRRANALHAEARDRAVRVHLANRARGLKTAAKRWDWIPSDVERKRDEYLAAGRAENAGRNGPRRG